MKGLLKILSLVNAKIYFLVAFLLPVGYIWVFLLTWVLYEILWLDIFYITFWVYLLLSVTFLVLWIIIHIYSQKSHTGNSVKYVPNIDKFTYILWVISIPINIIVFIFVYMMLHWEWRWYLVEGALVIYFILYSIMVLWRLQNLSKSLYLYLILFIPIPFVQIAFLIYLAII